MAKRKEIQEGAAVDKIEEQIVKDLISQGLSADESLKTISTAEKLAEKTVYDTMSATCYPAKHVSSVREYSGLVDGVEYPKDKFGFVDWKSLIDKKYFVLNKWNYASKYGIDVMALSQEEKDKMVLEAKDEDLLILLNGFKEVAKLRGYQSIESELLSQDQEKSVVKVTIQWKPNFETDYAPLSVSAIKSSSPYNTHKDFVRYSEAIAENRAFVTVVRNSLSIPVIGNDEIKEDEEVEVKFSAPKPNKFLKEFCERNKITFEQAKESAKSMGYEWNDDWEDYSDLSASKAGSLLHDLSRLVSKE